jgi:hypothetical protein
MSGPGGPKLLEKTMNATNRTKRARAPERSASLKRPAPSKRPAPKRPAGRRPAATQRPAAAKTQAAGDGVRRGTGRAREDWFALLDKWGAVGRPYREIADWLVGKHDLSDWWAQKLIVEYEQARGVRPPGVRRDGTFSVGASRTVGVPLKRLFDAFVDPALRKRWLPGAVMRKRDSKPSQVARFDWGDDGSRIEVTFADKGNSSVANVEHQRLPNAAAAEQRKAFWRERLAALKEMLER